MPSRTPPSSFPRERESRAGARRGARPFSLSLSKPVLRAHEGGLPHASFPASAETSPPYAGRHTDTALLPPHRCLRYRLPMEVISHRNQNITDHHAVGHPSLIVAGMVRIDGHRRLGKQQGRLFSLCTKILGFVAKMCQTSYDSNAKTTLPPATVATPCTPPIVIPAEAGTQRRGARPFALSLSKPVLRAHEGGPPQASFPASAETSPPYAGRHPDTASLPPHRCLRYRLPMEVEISHRNRNITGPHAVGRADLILAGMVRIDGQRRLGKQQGRLFPLCKKLFGFVAKVCQASYDSNAKTTLNNPTARHGRDTLHSPHRHSCGGRNLELRGASVRPEPVEACPEGTRRGPPARVIPTREREPHPLAPDSILTRPYCPHTGASATVSPWKQFPTGTGTSRALMPSGAPA